MKYLGRNFWSWITWIFLKFSVRRNCLGLQSNMIVKPVLIFWNMLLTVTFFINLEKRDIFYFILKQIAIRIYSTFE